jgi:S1-C subfamily serine protease
MTRSITGALTGAFILAGAGLAGPLRVAPVAIAAQEAHAFDFDVFRGAARIGVTVRDVSDDAAKGASAGVVVEDVVPDSAAAKAGFKKDDAIVEFDGERVRSVRQFTRLVQETPIGRKVDAVVVRAGQRTTLTVTPERGRGLLEGRFDGDRFLYRMPEPPEPPEAPSAPRPPRPPVFAMPSIPEFGVTIRRGSGRLGIVAEDLSEGLSEYFGVKDGALVRSVTDGSPASKAGLKAGDVITAINGTKVERPSDVSRALERLDENAEFTIEVMRDRKAQTLKGKLEPRSDRVRQGTRTVV